MDSSRERIYLYDNLKFFLIFAVVLGHSLGDFLEGNNLFKSVFIFIYAFHML